jgi:hypothetical protein
MYRYTKNETGIDSTSLLIDKFEVDAAGNSPQNCATVAMRYVLSKFGKKVTDQQLSNLIENAKSKTSLYAMRQFATGKGLYCRAIKTDLKTLKNLKDCRMILHIPGKSHYYVLGSIDSNYVRVIDLTSRKFFDRYTIDQFRAEWADGTALIISDKPINSQQNLTEIDDSTLRNIIGAGGFSCSRLLQNYGVIICDHPIGGLCGGIYEEFFERWTCEAAETGTCSPTLLQREQTTDCITDPYDPTGCTITGEWTTHFIRSCM